MKVGDRVHSLDRDGSPQEHVKISKIIKRFGTGQVELQEAHAGDIVSIAGFENATVGYTITTPNNLDVIPSIPVDPPRLSLSLTYNDSPLYGEDGDKLTI